MNDMKYLLTYDLRNQRDYRHLYRLMAAWNAVKITESQWAVDLALDAHQIGVFVAGALDADDAYAVLELRQGAKWASCNVSAAANAWLGLNIAPLQQAA